MRTTKLKTRPVYNKLLMAMYSGTSLLLLLVLRSPTGLGKSDINGEVTLLKGVICTVEYNI